MSKHAKVVALVAAMLWCLVGVASATWPSQSASLEAELAAFDDAVALAAEAEAPEQQQHVSLAETGTEALPTDAAGLEKLAKDLKAKIAKRRQEARAKRLAQEKKGQAALDKRDRAAEASRAAMRKVKPYGKSIRLGNYMTGGPKAQPAPKSKLDQYYERMHARANAVTPAQLKLRRATLAKIDRLYAKAKPSEATYLVEMLRERGVTVTAKKAMEEWAAAKNFLRQHRLLEAEAEAREAKQLKAAQSKAAKGKDAKRMSLEEIKKKATKLSAAEADRLATIEDKLTDKLWLQDYPLHAEGENGHDNWWGCVDCAADESSGKLGIPSKLDPEDVREAAFQRILKAGKKAQKALRKSKGKKGGKKGKAGKIPTKNGRVSGRAMGKPGKGIKLPSLDLTYNNMDLLMHYLERFQLRNELHDVTRRAGELLDRLKTRVVEKMLTPAERNEMLLAKTEALEKALAYRSGQVKMVKRVPNAVSKPSPKWPSASPPSDGSTIDYSNAADIAFAEGYLSPAFRTEKHDLDIAINEDKRAMAEHDAIVQQHNIIRKDIVWRQFDGEGDSHQRRSTRYNKYRKQHPHEALPDGTSPW